jgi:hypothetical protein
MKLWEIKAQALRLMFADTDVEFSEAEFQSGTIYTNANTREKLVRMVDSIRRAIDLYYQYNGEQAQTVIKTLDSATVSNVLTYFNTLTFSSSPSNFGFPSRIDVMANITENIGETTNITYDYDPILKKVIFTIYDFVHFTNKISFRVYYKISKTNLTGSENEITYDLDSLGIPPEIQRQIPLFVKGELYQEDEPMMAQQAKQEFTQFLVLNQRKTFTKNQTKVKKAFKRNFDV